VLGSNGAVKLMDLSGLRRADLFFVVLMDAVGDTLLPEIHDIFGEEATLKFLRIFEGTTIRVPSESVITNSLKDVQLYLSMHSINRKSEEDVARVARTHRLGPRAALRVYRRIRNLVRGVDR
jgi:hypothetical protein